MMEDEGPCTLYVRHLPDQLPVEEREDLLRFFGARSVRCMSDTGNMKYSAFAVFQTPEMAAHALLELHQLEVLGSRLNATFSSRQFLHPAPVKAAKAKKDTKPEAEAEKPLESVVPDDIDDLASNHKVNYPINPKLMYSYPPPTVEILTNIANALASVPKFYVQVLHLMNKMNLPAPFGPMTQGPPVPSGVSQQPIQELDMHISSSEESELESDNEGRERVSTGGVPAKRPSSGKRPIIKRQKLQKIISAPKTGKVLKPNEVFEKPPVDVPAKAKSTKETVAMETNDADIFTDEKSVKKFITLKELEKQRLPPRRMRKVPLFKDYEAGDRSSCLLVENLHKDIPEAMVTYVFGRYINWENESESSAYSVDLNREDKSCTVAFPSEDIAELALQETNGYKLMGEYILVKFAPEPPPVEVETEPEVQITKPKVDNEAIVAENLNVIEAAFSVETDAPVEDVLGAGATPPRDDKARTPEPTEAATPEPDDVIALTPERTEAATPEPGMASDSDMTEAPSSGQSPCPPSVESGELVDNEATSSGVLDAAPESDGDEKKEEDDGDAASFNDAEEEEELEDYEDSRYISSSELEKCRITEDKMVNFKVFNKYKPGEASNRLYVKNLNHKEIKEFEFVWLFGRFLKDKMTDAADNLDIKIMKEGRMKGQAFVTFPSTQEARTALKAVNGFVLHGKPMVVQFGKQT